MKESNRKPGGRKRKWHVIMGSASEDDCPLCRKMREDEDAFGEPMILPGGIMAFPGVESEDLRDLLRDLEGTEE